MDRRIDVRAAAIRRVEGATFRGIKAALLVSASLNWIFEDAWYNARMTRSSESKPQMPAPRRGMVIEPITTYEELPIVTESARAELVASLERGAEDAKAGRIERMSVAELKADMRADFERITGYKLS